MSARHLSRRRLFGVSGGMAAAALAAGCSALPSDGPRTKSILEGANAPTDGKPVVNAPYVLVDLTEAVARAATAQDPSGPEEAVSASLPRAAAVGLLGPGDMLHVTLWEPNPTGQTLLDKPGLDLTVRVAPDGGVTVPYVGHMKVAGRTASQVEDAIRAALGAQGHEMQAAVLVSEDVTNSVVVQGDVVRPGRYPVATGARGLLDVLALAGGAKGQNQAAAVRVTRGHATIHASLAAIVGDPSLDVQLAPGDRVLVMPRVRYFYALGSVNHPGEQPYDSGDLNMARTLARIAGLSDSRANPSGVFIYRRQAADLTRRIVGQVRPDQDPTKVIYRLDLRDPQGFFISQAFRIMPEDLVYVSEAPLAEATAAIQLIAGISGVAAIPRNLGGGF